VRRIICIGNRYRPDDAAGPAVHDLLEAAPLPPGIELVDGGLRGLDLLPLVEGCERVVFVDQARRLGRPGSVHVLTADEAAGGAAGFDHAAGLPYLLGCLPHVCAGAVPEVLVVAVEEGGGGGAVAAAASLATRLAAGGTA
jgi:hydrogenase maturation protease